MALGTPGGKGRDRLRLAGRCAALAGAAVLALGVLPWPEAVLILPALSPYVAVGSAAAARAATWITLLGLPVLVLAILLPRGFCRYACPVGLMAEMVGRLRRGGGRGGRRRVPPLGGWVLFLTLGGACLGYPVLLWMDPLVLATGSLGALRGPASLASAVAGLGLPLILLASLVAPNFWCGRLCPLGAMQDVATAMRDVPRRLARRRAAAPAATDPGSTAAGADPAPAAGGTEPAAAAAEVGPAARGWTLARRAVLGAGLGGAWTLASRAARGAARPPLRPPGAVAEDRFLGMCVRCGNCGRACPSGVIRPDLGRRGAAAFLAPELRFDADYCREDCRLCGAVCPSGALAALTLEQKRGVVLGVARVDLERCLLAGGQECTVCAVRCPYGAILVEPLPAQLTSYPGVVAGRCVGCGACEAACPTSPVKAITVVAGGGPAGAADPASPGP